MTSYADQVRQLLRSSSEGDDILTKIGSATDEEREGLVGKLKSRAEPVDLRTRMGAKQKVTPAGVSGFLESRYGKGNVIDVGDGNFAVRRKGAKPLLLEGAGDAFSEFGKDILDVLPEIEEAGYAVGGALAGTALGGPVGTVAGGAAGAMAGRTQRQARSAALPGEDFPGETTAGRVGQRVMDVAETGAADAAAPAVLGFGASLLKAIGGPVAKRIPGTAANLGRKLASEAADEGVGAPAATAARQAYATADGAVAPTLSEATMGSEALKREAALRKTHPEMFRTFDLKRATEMAGKVDEALEGIGPSMGAEEAGGRVAMAHQGAVSAMLSKRKEAGDIAFAKARELTGDRAVIDTKGTLAAIDGILEKGSTGSEALQELRTKLASGASIRTFQDQLAQVGAAVGGDLKLVSARGGKGNRDMARQVFAAMMGDLDTAAAAPLVGRGPGGQFTPKAAGEAARALKAAREGYRVLSEGVEQQRKSTLARALKRMAPRGSDLETMAAGDMEKTQSLARAISGSTLGEKDVARLLNVADRIDPEAANGLRRAVLEDMLTGSRVGAATTEARVGASYDLTKLAEALLGAKGRGERIATVLGPKSPQYAALKKLAERARDIGAAAKARGSAAPDGPSLINKAISPMTLAAAGATLTGGPGGAVAAAASEGVLEKVARRLSNPKSLAKVFIDPEASMVLLGLMNPPKKASKGYFARTGTRLLSLLEDDASEAIEAAMGEDDKPGVRLARGAR